MGQNHAAIDDWPSAQMCVQYTDESFLNEFTKQQLIECIDGIEYWLCLCLSLSLTHKNADREWIKCCVDPNSKYSFVIFRVK